MYKIKERSFFSSDWAVGSNTYKFLSFLISLVNNTEQPQSGAPKQNEVTSPCYEVFITSNIKLPARESEPTVPLWGTVVGDTWESSSQIWIFYLNYYKSRPFVVGQTSIRKLTSNLDKFRFDRHVLIRHSVFNRNLQPADLLCQHWMTSKLGARRTLKSAANKGNFWSLSVCLANAFYFDSLSTQ